MHISSNWYCTIDNTIITSNIEKRIKEHIYSNIMQSFLYQNKNYTKNSFTYIDWNAIEKATKMLTLNRRIWLTKFVSGFCATASKMHTRKIWDSSLCPICNKDIENIKHIIICTDDRVQKKYQTLLKEFIKSLDKINTHPDIISVFHNTLLPQHPSSFTQTSIKLRCDHNIIIAAQEQDEIQWHNFFKGHISKKWKTIQQLYLQKISMIYSSPDAWLKQVISHIYKFSFQIWDHRNSIIHTKTEEYLTHKESKNLEKKLIKLYLQGKHNVMEKHKYMFDEDLNSILNRSVREKQYWILTIEASRKYIKSNINMTHHTNDQQSIEKQFAIVPD